MQSGERVIFFLSKSRCVFFFTLHLQTKKMSVRRRKMEKLANSFSVLELDADDSHVHPLPPPSPSTATHGHSDERVNGNGDTSLVKIEKQKSDKRVNGNNADSSVAKDDEQNQLDVAAPLCEYKMPLVWIDLEMTGLNIEVDRILEIACIITDGNLTKSVEGPDLVIHQSKECLDRMGEWCQSHHAASGLTKKVLKSTISEREAEKQVIEFVKRHLGSYTYSPLLAGNSVYVDFQFLKKYMPELAALFSHVLVDVSSVKALCIRWYPRDQKRAPSKENKHRAMDDIRESIEELRYYKASIFKPKSKK
ncbi:hypothetical protein HN51_023999 [Arachis hypogaea]|uniref:Exonuclease domain-containing protein n=1 Tax=Arachis hypogaea TaxID=3818 RepID=A0A445C488_ARAHY|nr:oligoribonuclease [Arachis hypogaea]QHO26977.1 Oligoribonuclease [Arachis hypogaea]RYR45742.1 hypothetical protein Ahy_A07g031540 isoform B [Arachis hypogaea]